MYHLYRFVSLLLISLTASSAVASAQAADPSLSPVVIAQGVVTFTGDSIDWRAYEFEADPRNPRQLTTAAAGFTFVYEGGLIVADANSGHEFLLSAGEAAFSNDGDLLLINTESADQSVYRRIVLLPDDFEDGSANRAAFTSDGFTIPVGKREIELSVGSLADDSMTYHVPASDKGIGLLMILSGEAIVTGADGPETLESGAYLDLTEDLDITTHSETAFAAVRIGPAIRDVNQPLPADAGSDNETPTPGAGNDSGDGTGSLTLQLQVCGMGGQAGGCTNTPDATVLEISGAGLGNGPILTYEIAANDEGVLVLPDLPYGDYVIQNVADETGNFETEGGVPDPNQPNVYTVTISDSNPAPVFTVRSLPPPGDGVIAVELYACPDGLPGIWAQPWFCPVELTRWELSLTSDAFAGTLRTSDAPASDTGYTFSGLPVGYEYRLAVDAAPIDYPFVQVKPEPEVDGPVRIDLQASYSVQIIRFYAVTTNEINMIGTDTDGDQLPDDFEINVLGTDPMLTDSDEDSVWDGAEVSKGTNPFDPSSYSFG